MKSLEAHEAQLCFFQTVLRAAHAGLYDAIEHIKVSSDVFDSLNWIEIDGDLIERIVKDPSLPLKTCMAFTNARELSDSSLA